MTANEIISKAFNLFDQASGSKYDSTDRTFPLMLVNDGYKEICRETHCSRKSTVITTIPGTREYTLPSDFYSLHSIDYQGKSRLDPTVYQRNDKDYGYYETGVPERYYLITNQIGFVPIPNDGQPANLVYFCGPDSDLTLNDSPDLIPERWHNVLVYYVVSVLFQVDRGAMAVNGPTIMAQWSALYQKQLQTMIDYYDSGMNADRIPDE